MEENGQLQALGALPSGKALPKPTGYEVVSAQIREITLHKVEYMMTVL
jgi:hypothetical protein